MERQPAPPLKPPLYAFPNDVGESKSGPIPLGNGFNYYMELALRLLHREALEGLSRASHVLAPFLASGRRWFLDAGWFASEHHDDSIQPLLVEAEKPRRKERSP
jgi:hypothetical protein